MYKRLLSLISTFVLIGNLQAHHVFINKDSFRSPIRTSAVITQSNTLINSSANQAIIKTTPLLRSDVFLMNIPLSAQQKNILKTFKSNHTASTTKAMRSKLPEKVELGMNKVPVLEQGKHGACATFANTAAIDSLLRKGHYISELCILELSEYLEKRSYFPSGWDGSISPYVLGRLQEFGIVSIDNQLRGACGGVTKYPGNEEYNRGIPISLDQYAATSESINENIYWYSLLTPYERFAWDLQDAQPDALLQDVKSTLAAATPKVDIRLTFGVLLPTNHCSAGACAKHHKTDDTWALTKAIIEDKEPLFGGHEMIITGYDDNAVATDNEGIKHTGLLILRNSWGDKHGDNGDYYMTYDFFSQYVIEVQAIVKDDILENE